MSNNKMKGLLKGLRYISQMFENEKEAEIQIGYPTDVKHVAHIGLDGQSDVKAAAPRFASAPLSLGGGEESSNNAGNCSPARDVPTRDLPDVRKATRRHASAGSAAETPLKEKPEKTKQSKKSLNIGKSKEPSQGQKQEGDSPAKRSEIPKKTRRKKSKESMEGSSKSSRSRRAHGHKSDLTSESELVSRADDHCQNSSEGGEDKGFIGIS